MDPHNQSGASSPLRILIGYESSGTSREAFRRLGHDAWSCDLLPADDGSPFHRQCDIREVVGEHWDLAIFHPSCTFLTCSAEWAYADPDFVRYPNVGYHQKVKPGTLTGQQRCAARDLAVEEVKWLWSLPIPRVVIENPKGALSSRWMKPSQIIQPHEFGDDASKGTCLWIRGLMPLVPTLRVPPRLVNGKPRWANQTDGGQNKLAPSKDRWKQRSKTYPGIASAFAQQWGGDSGWRHVSYAADCTGENGDDRSICGLDYSNECQCPGPTQDGYQYEEFHGNLMAQKTI